MKRKLEDRFEKYILDHRDEFDHESPPDKVWTNIISTLDKKDPSPFRLSNWMWKAAAVLFFASTSVLVLQKYVNRPNVEESSLSVEFSNTENYYNSLIQSKREKLESLFPDDNNLMLEFENDILELDSMYTILKNEYNCYSDELVMDAMIRNLQIRLEIMDQQLKIIQNINSNAKNDETVSI